MGTSSSYAVILNLGCTLEFFGNLSKTPSLQTALRAVQSEAQTLVFFKLPRWFQCRAKFENLCFVFFFNIFIYLLIWLLWVLVGTFRIFIAPCGIFRCRARDSLVVACRLSCCRLLDTGASAVVACSLSSCGTRALECVNSVVAAHRLSCSMACGVLVPRAGIKPEFPALQVDS